MATWTAKSTDCIFSARPAGSFWAGRVKMRGHQWHTAWLIIIILKQKNLASDHRCPLQNAVKIDTRIYVDVSRAMILKQKP